MDPVPDRRRSTAPCVSGLVRFLEQIERFLNSTQRAIDQRQVIGRDVTSSRQISSISSSARFRGFHISRRCVSCAEPAQRVRRFAHQLDDLFARLQSLLRVGPAAEHETRGVEHHQVVGFVLER